MKKIGIITFHKAINYGAVLQGYALAKYLYNLGHEAEIINYNSHLYDHYKLERKSNFLVNAVYTINRIYIKKKYKKFETFSNKELPLSSIEYDKDNINKKYMDTYEILFTGSDQVWNPELIHDEGAFLLDFVNDNKKRNSYAASIGLETLPDSHNGWFKKEIKKYNSISVRENKAKEILRDLGIENVTVVCDPTLLLSEMDWEKIEKKVNTPKKYILVFSFGKDVDLWQCAKRMASQTGYTLCTINDIFLSSKSVKQFKGIGPEEWVYLIHHAECIFTNSYHGMMFAIIFKRNFWVSDPKDGTNSRIVEMLERINCSDRIIEYLDDVNISAEIDYDDKKILLDKFINKSKKYIGSVINSDEPFYDTVIKKNDNKEIKHIVIDNKCNGCSACFAICPSSAIDMSVDGKGSLFPKIDKEKCIECGLCKSACSLIVESKIENKFTQEYYAFKTKNNDDLRKCSSGGIFLLVAKKVLEQGGVVYGVKYDESLNAVYGRIDNENDLWELSGTKYIECDKIDIFTQVKKDLTDGRKVLFSGSPCVIAGLNNILIDNQRENLVLMDIICHGTPVPKVYKDYLNFLEKKYKSKIVSINFRKKEYDNIKQKYINIQNMEIKFANGKTYTANKDNDFYYRLFWSNNIIRESCFSCKFASLERVSDITIGDYWGNTSINPEFFHECTESTVIINTTKGKEIFNSIKLNANIMKVSKKDCLQRNLYKATPKSNNFDRFWNEYMLFSFKYILIRYADYYGVFKLFRKVRNHGK